MNDQHDTKQDEQEEMTPERRAKLMERIKKCLALGASPEPHEAAAAMRQAQKLMAKLGVSEDDVEGISIGEARVKTREGYGNCRYMNHLTDLVEKAFGVRTIYSRNPGTANRLNVRYFGPKSRVALAEYVHRVIQRALEAAWSDYLARQPWKKGVGGVRQSFYIGWIMNVRAQVMAMAPTEREAALTARYVDRHVGALELLESKKQQDLDYKALNAGHVAAADFTLHHAVEEEQLKLENK